jgi:RNA polymerase sigma-B factor
MTMDLGRPPAVAELAQRSGHDPDVVLRALDVGSARTARSLDSPTGDGAEGMANQPVAALADTERGFEQTEVRLSVSRLLDGLDDRLRRVVELRFFEELTQQEIADRLGISQMHVSRLLRSALEKLRAQERR